MLGNSLITTDLKSGIGSEKLEPSEWLGVKSRAVEEKLRHFSADLERRRIRRYNQYVEEEQKVREDLDKLQNDRMRFEREKQLRKRNGLRLQKAKEHSFQSSQSGSKLPMNKNAFGASASLAFDPSVEKYRRRRTRTDPAKTHNTFRKTNRKTNATEDQPRVFPYIDETDVLRFHEVCKSAAENRCKRWGAAWLYAKKVSQMFKKVKTS